MFIVIITEINHFNKFFDIIILITESWTVGMVLVNLFYVWLWSKEFIIVREFIKCSTRAIVWKKDEYILKN